VCLFPLWPPEVRLGVYYLSVAAACFVALIFILCIGEFRRRVLECTEVHYSVDDKMYCDTVIRILECSIVNSLHNNNNNNNYDNVYGAVIMT